MTIPNRAHDPWLGPRIMHADQLKAEELAPYTQ